MPPPDNTPALCRKLAQLLTVWQQIEAGKNPVWNELTILPGQRVSTDDLRLSLGNLQDDVNPMLKELRAFNLITTRLAGVGRGQLHEINREAVEAIETFLRNHQTSKGINPESLKFTAQFIQEMCQVIGHKSGLPFALWQVISTAPHTSGQAATAVGCSAGEASKALGKLVDCGLAHAPIHKGQFRIYRGIDGLDFLQDAGKLVEAGIIKL